MLHNLSIISMQNKSRKTLRNYQGARTVNLDQTRSSVMLPIFPAPYVDFGGDKVLAQRSQYNDLARGCARTTSRPGRGTSSTLKAS